MSRIRKYVTYGTAGLTLDILGVLILTFSLRINDMPDITHNWGNIGPVHPAFISFSSKWLALFGLLFIPAGFFALILNEIKNRQTIDNNTGTLANLRKELPPWKSS